LFPSLTGTNLFGVIFFKAFAGGLLDLDRVFKEMVEGFGFGVVILASNFGSSKEI
jgi:hypothetical protein